MSEDKKPRQMPKGGRTGGSVFPRVSLKEAVGYARKLVSKTHTGAQSIDIIFSGVVGAKSGTGRVKISALKQYGFIKGDVKSGFSATDLAKKVASSPPDEIQTLYVEAVLRPTVFKGLFDTFHGDSVTRAKLKQRAADLQVHPDQTDTCVELYISGIIDAGLARIEGDRVVHQSTKDIADRIKPGNDVEEDENLSDTALEEGSDDLSIEVEDDLPLDSDPVGSARTAKAPRNTASPKAVFNVNVTLDSSMDIEKLQKQLELLKKFGAI